MHLPAGTAASLAALCACVLALSPFHARTTQLLVAAIGPAALWQACAVTPNTGAAAELSRQTLPCFRDSHDRMSRSRLVWAVWFLALCAWEAIAYILSRHAGDERANPTVTVLLEPSMQSSAGRAVFAVAWLGFGLGWVFRGDQR
mgnify:FL=1